MSFPMTWRRRLESGSPPIENPLGYAFASMVAGELTHPFHVGARAYQRAPEYGLHQRGQPLGDLAERESRQTQAPRGLRGEAGG